MKDSLSRQVCQYGWLRLGSMVVVLGLVVVTVQGTVLESSRGWITCPPFVWSSGIRQQERRQRGVEGELAWQLGSSWWRQPWVVVALRSEVLWGLVLLTGQWPWSWVVLLPPLTLLLVSIFDCGIISESLKH